MQFVCYKEKSDGCPFPEPMTIKKTSRDALKWAQDSVLAALVDGYFPSTKENEVKDFFEKVDSDDSKGAKLTVCERGHFNDASATKYRIVICPAN